MIKYLFILVSFFPTIFLPKWAKKHEAVRLNFFSKVPKEEQERLERTINVKAWKGLKNSFALVFSMFWMYNQC